jgi:YesN/AraC family two-component response regulator
MPCRVLIVEDEIINAMALETLIPMWGFVVAGSATDGAEAMRLAESERPDVVLMDITIHGPIDGLEAGRHIIGRLGIPVIFMSGYDDPETLRQATELAPHAFLVKPLDETRLRESLEGIENIAR